MKHLRHRYRAKFHGECPRLGDTHWHVTCRSCKFEWLEPTLFDPRRFEVSA